MTDLPTLTYYGPMHGPDHPSGPTVGPHVLAWKRMLWRWDAHVFPGPALAFDDVFNRRTQNATRVAQRFWNLTASGNVGKTTFERSLRALRKRGAYKPVESAWDSLAISLYRKAAPRVPPAKCWIYPDGTDWRYLGGVAAHMARALGNWQSDNAIDAGARPGSLLLAPKGGYISRIGGTNPRHGVVGTIFGQSLTISCSDGDGFFFTHTERIVGVGETVVAGQIIARVADWPGSSAMDHAHMGRVYGRNPEEVQGWPKVKAFV